MNFKLRYLLFFLLICTYNQSRPMNWLSNSSNPVVTEPYKPGLCARYPGISNFLKSSALGGLATFGANQAGTNNSFAIGAAAFAAIFAYNAFKPPVLDSLLTNPYKALIQGYKIRTNFADKFKNENGDDLDLKKQLSTYKKLKKETKKKSPLFLLGECTEGCVLSRAYESDYRKIYEDRVIAALSAKSKILEQPMQYTSFGCGGMFQDLVVITKFLAQNPNAKIDIHLIDMQHTPYCGIRNLLQKDFAVKPKENIDLEPEMEKIIALAREKWGAEKLSDNVIKNSITISYIEQEDKGKQFISYLRKTFPHAQISLCLHASTDDYIIYLKEHNIPYPDIVTAADIMDEMSLLKKSAKNYISLCIKTLQNKPESTNIWLDKENYTQAEIMSIFLEDPQTANTEKTEFKLDKENKIPYYCTSDNITKNGWLTSIIKRIFGIFRF